MNSSGGRVLTASINRVMYKDCVSVCNFVLPLTTIGKIDVFSISSVELKVSVMVFKAGVACVCEAIITAGRVSILELKSVSDTVNSGPEDVRIFSGAGIVSV